MLTDAKIRSIKPGIGQTQANYAWMGSHKIELSRDLDSGANLKVAYDSDGDNLQVVTSVEF